METNTSLMEVVYFKFSSEAEQRDWLAVFNAELGKRPGFYEREMPGYEIHNEVLLTKIRDVHLMGDGAARGVGAHSSFLADPNSWDFIYFLLWVGGAVLVVSCLNTNMLATALCIRQAKITGVKKVLGGSYGQLLRQFFVVSLLKSMAALLLAFALLWVLRPWLIEFTKIDAFSVNVVTLEFLLAAALFVLVVSLLAIWYPAVILKHIQPVSLFQGFRRTRSSRAFIGAASAVQYCCSAVMVTLCITLYWQANYFATMDLGVDLDNTFTVGYDTTAVEMKDHMIYGRVEALVAKELKEYPGAESVSTTLPSGAIQFPGWAATDADGSVLIDDTALSLGSIEEDFWQHFDVRLLAGRAPEMPAQLKPEMAALGADYYQG